MRFLTLLIFLSFLGCRSFPKNQSSYWETQKGNFKYQNKIKFESDSILRADQKTLKKFNHPLFNSTIGNSVYLYSWQDRDKSKSEFTVIDDRGERGLAIHYYILNKWDSLLSCTQIAGKGLEGGYSFETSSKFVSHDTILNIGAITQLWNFDKQMKMEKPKGDTTFSYMIIDSKGNVTEKLFKEVKDLNYENN